MSVLPLHDTISLLQESTCTLPDIYQNLPGLPPRCSVHVGKLTRDVNEWLDRTLEPGKLLDKLKNNDFGIFSAYINPYASYERARILAYWNVWLFVFDDAMDEPSATYGSDAEKLVSFCEESKKWLEYTLGLCDPAETVTPPADKRLRHFDVIGEALKEAWPEHDRQRWFQELVRYIDGCAKENQVVQQQGGVVPTVDEYWNIRVASGAVFTFLHLVPYAAAVDLPPAVWEDQDLKKIILNIVYDGHAVNDVFSLAKELKGGGWLNLIVILVSRQQAVSLQDAVEQIGVWLRGLSEEVLTCQDRALERWAKSTGDEKLESQLRRFIECCRITCAGNRMWCLTSKRYGYVGKDVTQEGNVRLDMVSVLGRQRQLTAA